MRRREFLIGVAAAAGVTSVRHGWALAQTPPASRAKQTTLDRMAIMSLNFDRMLKLPDLPDGPQRTLELFDLPQMLADTYGVHKVEFQHYHIPSTESSYLKELRAQIEKRKSRMTQINLEFGNRLFTSAGIGSTPANAGDMKAQTTEALTRLGLTLKAAGFDYKGRRLGRRVHHGRRPVQRDERRVSTVLPHRSPGAGDGWGRSLRESDRPRGDHAHRNT